MCHTHIYYFHKDAQASNNRWPSISQHNHRASVSPINQLFKTQPKKLQISFSVIVVTYGVSPGQWQSAATGAETGVECPKHQKMPSTAFLKDYWESLVHIYTSITHPEPCTASLPLHMKENESRNVSQISQLFLYDCVVKQGLSSHVSLHITNKVTCHKIILWTAFISSMIIWWREKPFQVIKLLFHFYSCWLPRLFTVSLSLFTQFTIIEFL